ncbi:phage tail protein [Teredinibacter sp. KSP-S5-2]|uniref:phage tail protein n=1 Tax=Teredinibacter sp. KSP-S5-2 TaxID=3034506 RepID=UPI0029340F14|nr:phage tail protein [Teredinibacter sp. KSP-S5-2]WNO11490.1 phage tail protein [Teredinibacter sp. KSP-S5-2]
MSQSAVFQDAQRIGLDPNNAQWISLTYEKDWQEKVTLKHLIYDAHRNVIELEPLLPEYWQNNNAWFASEPVADSKGNVYRVDSKKHQLLIQKIGTDVFQPVENISGPGHYTGCLNTPISVTVDRRDWLYVADSANHRVQVIRPEDGTVVATLGEVDDWGRPLAGDKNGAMVEPVHVAVDEKKCRIYVVDRAAIKIHIFDHRFHYLSSFTPVTWEPHTLTPRAEGIQPEIVAVAVLADSSLAVLDLTRPRLQHMTASGEPLHDIAFHALNNPFQGGRPLPIQFVVSGELYSKAIDSRSYHCHWHKLAVQAEFPQGTQAHIQSFASDEPVVDGRRIWAPINPVAIPAEFEPNTESITYTRLVQSDTQRWLRQQQGPFERVMPKLSIQNTGPDQIDEFYLPGQQARKLRINDQIEFDNGLGDKETHTVSDIAPVTADFALYGVQRLYTAGARVYIKRRTNKTTSRQDDFYGQPRLLLELTPGQTLDLHSNKKQGHIHSKEISHSIAAFFQPGDEYIIRQGNDVSRIIIEGLDEGLRKITLSAATQGDYSTSYLTCVFSSGRLFAGNLSSFDHQTLLNEPVIVESLDPLPGSNAQLTFVDIEPNSDIGQIWLKDSAIQGSVDFANWRQFYSAPAEATDRGQYIWLRLKVFGTVSRQRHQFSLNTPSIHALRVQTPRFSYLRMLPALFSRRENRLDPTGSLFIERFLALFENKLTDIEAAYESVSRLLNPETTNEEWLQFLSTWLGLVFDPSWPLARRRQLILEAAELFQKRGTGPSLQRYIEIYTGRQPQIMEGFQYRPSQALVVGQTGRLGCSRLDSVSCDDAPYAHKFTIYVYLDDDCERQKLEPVIRHIIELMKPAHTQYHLCVIYAYSRVGLQSRVGIDIQLGNTPSNSLVLGQGPVVVPYQYQPELKPVLGREIIGNSNYQYVKKLTSSFTGQPGRTPQIFL